MRKVWCLSCLLAVAAGCTQEGSESNDPLAAALAAVRPGEGRLFGAPWLDPGRESGSQEEVTVRKAARAAAAALARQITSDTLKDDAVAKLLAGQADSAIEGLSKAADLDPSNAVIWSDLAAAHLQRGKVASDPYEFVLALGAATRAVRYDPNLEAARFNRALALGRLSLYDQAAEEWRIVQQVESDALWVREVGMHARKFASAAPRNWPGLSVAEGLIEQGKLEPMRQIVADAPQSVREHVEEDLLVSWARAEKARDRTMATKTLEVSRVLADALVSVGGDPMAFRTIAQIDRALSSEPAQFHRLVGGFLLYAQGLDLSREDQFKKASSHFVAAREVLARERSPFAYWATYQVAYCMYQGAQYGQATIEVQALLRDPSSTPYHAVRGRALSLKGLMEGIEGHWTESLSSLGAAEAAFRAVQEIPQAAKVSATMAEELNILGKRKEAWRRLYPALMESSSFGRPEIRSFVCLHASWLAKSDGEFGVALEFQDEVVQNARLIGRPTNLVGAFRQRASLLTALGRTAEAAEDLKQARSYLQQIPDLSVRRIIEGDLLLAESELAGSTGPEQAIARLDEALRIFRDTSYHYRLGDALYQRALANKALGRNNAAERDLAAAIAELEQQRATVESNEHRISYLDRVKDIFDTMIELQIEQRQRPDEAFRFSEQAKARVLWDWMVTRPTREPTLPHLGPAASQDFDLASLQRELPKGTAVIEYAVLPEKTVLWVLHGRGELRWESVEIGSGDVEDLVRKLRRALLENRAAELDLLAEQAYDQLIRPAARHLAPGERLILIPDGALHALPFPVLRNRETGRYLVQDRALAVAPSLRVYAESRRRDRALVRGPGNVLVVAAPEFDRGIDPTLLPLSAGETEASIARTFPGSQVLRGREATREAFLQAAGDFEILHFGGHSVVNVDSPLLSQMLFAGDAQDPSRGVLYSGDVLRQRFPRTRLAVLASCGTALGKISRTEGVENLARPFLAAGVPTVVASLWNVEDQVTADFFVQFYQNLKRGSDLVQALQAAQIESLERGWPPRVWGAFEIIGGSVGYTSPGL